MEFRILGPLEVWEGNRQLPLGGAKQRMLLAILLTQANRVVATDRLIDLIWKDEPPETAANTLQVVVLQLRKVLEPHHARGTPYEVLVSQAPGYLIRAAPEQVDLYRFQQLRGEASEAHRQGRTDTAAAILREALALWRGVPLADLQAEPFALAEANKLNEQQLQALEERIDADLVLGRHADVIGELEALVGEHPLRERFRAQLMLALYRAGRQAEASDLFHKTRAVLVDELGMEPGPELQKLFSAVLKHDPALELTAGVPVPKERPSNNLPLQLTHFVGRAREQQDVKQLLLDSRLVTITGVGGVGKTRLAIEVAQTLVPAFPDGVWLAELAPVTDGSLVTRVVASTLGLREQAQQRVDDVLRAYLTGREILLVIDNCEHVIQPVAELVDRLLRQCSAVRILATSRESLRVEGEVVWPLVSLAESEAVDLFRDRAAAASSELRPENLPAVVDICRHLDGLPLGIELAAATLRTLPVQQIAASLGDQFRTMASGPRTAHRRQQTLEASIDWSYALLSEPERTLLRRLGVFGGSFGVEHVKAICTGKPVDADAAFRLLSNLVAKSLVTVDARGREARYSLLETIHQYSSERLARTGEQVSLHNRHLDWYLALAERAAVAIHGRDQPLWFDLLDAEYSNLRRALQWAAETGSSATARMAYALTFYWMVRGYFSEGREWLRLALGISTDMLTRARTLTGIGMLASFQGDRASASETTTDCSNDSTIRVPWDWP